jgi:phospholipid/cholesterol/gamma-HCH transport system substrate-binding protein
VRRAIAKHRRDFFAVIFLVVVAVLVGGYILSNQRFYAPKWVPIVGEDFFTLKGEFSTAQSVTPGQGQTVNIAGVRVGDIQKVDLVNGRAIVTMKIKQKYAHVYKNATMLLRPKTQLNDMIIELDPGDSSSGAELKSGATIPVSNSLPNVNPDEFLSTLDGDTRDYLRLLLGGAAEGLRGQGKNLSATFRRFEPTGRDLAKINGLLAKRRDNLARVIHNFQLLSTELGKRDDQLAKFVDSSNAVFQTFAQQDANIRDTISLLPDALSATQEALSKTDSLAKDLGPALAALRPGARALGPGLEASQEFFKTTTPTLEDQIRPFVRASAPTVKELRPTAKNLADLTPDLTTTFKVLNRLGNLLAYNPPGDADEGFLFYLAWANHLGASVFNTADAHGPIRRGLFLASCNSLAILKNIPRQNPALGVLVELLNAPSDTAVCPKTAGATATGG